MIGTGFKKLAQENGLKIASGVAYGSLRGYAATLSEGSGYKQIILTTKFADPARQQWLQGQLNGENLRRTYRVQGINWDTEGVQIIFVDNPGTLSKIRAFMDWFFPLLDQSSASKANVCAECGSTAENGCWKLIGGTAYYFHSACGEKAAQAIASQEQENHAQDGGSYATGTVGAILGSLLGAALWAAVLLSGFMASIVGFVISWLSGKGYDLCKGRQGKGKIAVLIVTMILGVVIGNLAAEYITVMQLIDAGELVGAAHSDILPIILATAQNDAEYLTYLGGNIAMGLLFAALGAWTVIRKTNRDVSDTKIVDLP